MIDVNDMENKDYKNLRIKCQNAKVTNEYMLLKIKEM